MNYIWSDLHLFHEAIICYENRPFTDVEEMTKELLNAWKDTIRSEDTIFNLGDFAFKAQKVVIKKLLRNLPGRKILVMGNHDRSKSHKWWEEVGFDEVYKYPIIYKDFFILSHEPIYVGPEMPYVNIHGHTHNESSNNPQKVNVSVEVTEYRPISLDDIIQEFIRGRHVGQSSH